MKGTSLEGTYNNLFSGTIENVKKCINVEYESTREDTFITL
jgi:hypothetical protein